MHWSQYSGSLGGAVLDIYSSGLALLSVGLSVPRFVAAAIDGVLMIAGSIYLVFVADNFIGPFQGFLITLGVLIAAWCGIFLGDFALRRRPYASSELLDAKGRYGSVRVVALVLLVIGAVVGWGLVTNSFASWLGWQGYLLGLIGTRRSGRFLGVREPRSTRCAVDRVRRNDLARPSDRTSTRRPNRCLRPIRTQPSNERQSAIAQRKHGHLADDHRYATDLR